MAAREDEAQAVVFDFVGFAFGRLGGERLGVLLFQRIEARTPADGVDRPEASGGVAR